MGDDKEIHNGNFGVREVMKKRTSTEWSEKAQANVLVEKKKMERIYCSMINFAEFIWLLSLGEVLYWEFMKNGGPVKNCYTTVRDGQRVIVTKRMMLRSEILDDDGNLEEPNKWISEKVLARAKNVVGDDSIIDVTKPIDPDLLENAKKTELEGIFAEILSSIQHTASKATAMALKQHLVNTEVLTTISISKNPKIEIKEAVEVLKEYMTTPENFDLDELVVEAQVKIDDDAEKAKAKAAAAAKLNG